MANRPSTSRNSQCLLIWRRHAARGIVAVLALWVLNSGINEPVRGQFDESVDARTVRGLAERRLYELARSHAEASLITARDDLERARLAAALIDVLTRNAMTSSPPQRESSWETATRRAVELDRELSGKPGSLLVSVQATLIDLARLEQYVREIEIGQAGDQERVEARSLSVRIQRDIQALKARLLEALNRSTVNRRDNDLDATALRGLRYNIEYQGARALILAGELYGKEDQTSRIDIMAQAESRLLECIQSIGPAESLWWSIQSDRLRAARMAGNQRLFSSIVSSLPSAIPDQNSRNRLNTELLLGRLENGQHKEALAIAGDESATTSTPDFDIARLKLFMVLARSDSGNSKDWQQKALDLTSAIEASHGAWWGRRASLMVVGVAGSTGDNTNLDLLVRVASDAQSKQQWAEAISALDAAIVQAESENENNRELAASLAFRAAAIEQDQKKHGEAAQRFEALAARYPEWPQAPSAHLMACWNMARSAGTDAGSLEKYQLALEHHIQTWPATATADQARLWLSAIFQAKQKWRESLVLLGSVAQSGALYPEALGRILDLIPFYLASQDSTSRRNDDWLIQLARTLEASLRKVDESIDVTGGAQARRFAELSTLAALRWVYGVTDAVDTGDELASLVSNPENAASSDRAKTLLLVRLAWNNGDASEIKRELQGVTFDASRLELLRAGWGGVYVDALPPRSCQEAILAAAELLASQIDGAGKRSRYLWDQSRVSALASIDSDGSIEKVRSIVAQYPADKAMQWQLGKYWLTLAARDPGQVGGALAHWRKIAVGCKTNTPEWFEAKLNVARLLVASGNTADARKLLEYMQAVPPGWKNSPLAGEFEQLLSGLPVSGDIQNQK